MYIKSMVIDGFKSYAQRTEVNGFDSMFNAITGLNGSGKSNILDSICFLLGISNLSQVRATNLQELVYKNGQAGVTKATVSITFDNSNKDQSPLGYEQYDELTITRQVVIGGRNKYLINGSNANNTRVQDLFRSVQLNVNNPHFLIMQGRITKVLNMKPPEILSMIEEAAGTKLYESKKENAQKTIEKKDAKLREIDNILKEEINPTLCKLKEERSSYLEYQNVIRELEHLNKLYIAYQFVNAQESSKQALESLNEMQELIKTLQNRQTEIADEVKSLTEAIEALEHKRDEEAGGTMRRLEQELQERQKEDAKSQSNLNHKKDALKAENKKMKDIKKNYESDKNALANKEKELKKIGTDTEQLQGQGESDKEAYAAAQKHFHAVSAGLSSNEDGAAASLTDQLMTAKKDISNADTEIKQSSMKLKHEQQEIKKRQTELKSTEHGYKKDQNTFNNLQLNIEKMKEELSKLDYEEGKEEDLTNRRRTLTQDVHHLKERVDTFEARFPRLQFHYRDPEKNFDRSKVHGLVARLIKVKDVKTATALEVSAGGKLYNVVVDTEVTGKKILQNGQLKARYTIIPLNKISARSIDEATVRRAESLVGKQNVQTALSLVGYPEDIETAMAFVFGNAFVCKDTDAAKKVTFDERVMKKCVTLDGDSFEPAGTLTGGARAKTGSVLAQLSELKEMQDSLDEKVVELNSVETQLRNIKKTAERFRHLSQQLDVKQREAQLLENKLKQSTHGQQLEELDHLKTSIDDQEQVLATAKDVKQKAQAKVKELEDKIKNAKQIRERELKQAETDMQKAKKKMEDSSKKMKNKEQECDGVRLEIEDIKKELTNYEEQIAATETVIQGYDEQLKELDGAAVESKSAVKQAQGELNKQKELLKACNKDIEQRIKQQRELHKEANGADLQIQETKHKIEKCQKDSKESGKLVEQMLQNYEWIVDEKKYFGKPNTAYDFEAKDPKEAGRRIKKLQETKEKLSKTVNMRAMNMLGKAEEMYNDLMKKRRIVLSDKVKIAAVIAELDEKKNEALKKAHTQVNKDFGSIFSTLLPGTQAKLVAPDGCSILDGLEVKVAFGDVWKESLTELSGGQRSLVALSLILSLLLFKPAPLYILDEVDAALDLSHTQNIGQMLRTHFRHSQFIVVSLKDGMFNNANVLFKTKFVDGVSTVTRYVQSQAQISGRTGSTSSTISSVSSKGPKKAKTSNKRPRIEEYSAPLSPKND